LRIVTVVPSLARNTGGPAVTLVQGTRAMGDSVERVIYTTDAAQPAATRPFRRLVPDDLPEGAADIRIRVFRTRPPYQLAFSPGLWLALRRAVPSADLVTIHSINLFPQYAAFTAAISARVPYIVTPHGALDPWLGRNSRLLKRLTNATWQRRMLANATAIHFTTADEARLAGGLTASAPHVIMPNGLDLSRFGGKRSGESFRAQRLGGFRGPVVLFLGRVARKKGIDLLIRGFARATPNRDSLLVIAGPDDESLTAELSAIAQELGVSAEVRFVGPVYDDDQLGALAAADVWALTSHTENFGNAVVEALAAGCPVLVSTEVNLAPQIAAADAGLVTGLSVDEIGAALHSLLENSEQRELLAARGRDFARRFDWSIVAPELVRVFVDVANRGRTSSGHTGGSSVMREADG
jgi:glycosyltransferase involved in cell wall biosynthesis